MGQIPSFKDNDFQIGPEKQNLAICFYDTGKTGGNKKYLLKRWAKTEQMSANRKQGKCDYQANKKEGRRNHPTRGAFHKSKAEPEIKTWLS